MNAMYVITKHFPTILLATGISIFCLLNVIANVKSSLQMFY